MYAAPHKQYAIEYIDNGTRVVSAKRWVDATEAQWRAVQMNADTNGLADACVREVC